MNCRNKDDDVGGDGDEDDVYVFGDNNDVHRSHADASPEAAPKTCHPLQILFTTTHLKRKNAYICPSKNCHELSGALDQTHNPSEFVVLKFLDSDQIVKEMVYEKCCRPVCRQQWRRDTS